MVVYSHGWTGFRTNVVHQIESLVSNGFIVVAIDHTYGAVTTRFPDGEVIDYDPAALPDPAEVGEEPYVEATEALLDVFSQDIVSVANALEVGPNGPFGAIAESVDLTRLGVYGNETGGGAAVQFCLEDERCDGCSASIHGSNRFPIGSSPVSAVRPALFMRSDDWRGTENDAILRDRRAFDVHELLDRSGGDR